MDSLGFKGKIKVWQEDRVITEGENHITTLWQELVAALGIDPLYTWGSPIEAGQSFAITQYPTFNTYYDIQNTDYLVTAYFLYLSDAEKNALSSSSTHLPIFTSTGEIDTAKVVGYASFKVSPTGTKEGYCVPLEGVDLVNHRIHGCQFKWDAGVAFGKFNVIAIGSNIMTSPYTGFRTARGVELSNLAIGEKQVEGYYIRPNVKTNSVVITNENEILIGDGTEVKYARKVLNLVTGEITTLDSTDIRYNFPLVSADSFQMMVGDYLVCGTSATLKKIDLSTKTVSSVTSYGFGGFIYDGYFYAPYSGTELRAYSLTDLSRVSSADKTADDFGIPTDFQKDSSSERLFVSQIASNRFLVACLPTASAKKKDTLAKAFICSDIGDAQNSFVETVPCLSGVGCFVLGEEIVFSSSLVPITNIDSGRVYYQSSSGAQISVYKQGVKLTKQGCYGNMLSFKVYDEDQTIYAAQATYLKYTYSFEQ